MCSGSGIAGTNTSESGKSGSKSVAIFSIIGRSIYWCPMKPVPGLYLVGFMASGKTTIGRALAQELGWPFIDIDTEIEAREGRAISQIFLERGESRFRSKWRRK